MYVHTVHGKSNTTNPLNWEGGGKEVINGWTKSEICMLYREAKDKKIQIQILTELTGLRTFEIERILEEGGYINQMTDLLKDRILQLYKQGLSDKAIGRELSVSQSQVSTFLRNKGLPANGKRFPKKIEEGQDLEEIKEYSIEVKTDEIKASTLESLKKETAKNYEELKEVLPKSIPAPKDMPIDCDVIETLTPQQYYELAKMTIQSINSMIETLRTVWEG